jgi:hypothetical protein
MSLCDHARRIADDDRHAGHSWRTIYVALEYVAEGDVNEATQRINALRGAAASGIPRWLVQRWAQHAGLTDPRPTLS